MPSFQYFLYIREQKKVCGLDPVNRGCGILIFVDTHYSRYSLLLESLTIREAEGVQCTQTETPSVVGWPELATAVRISRLLVAGQ
jgi:hypothetical protein